MSGRATKHRPISRPTRTTARAVNRRIDFQAAIDGLYLALGNRNGQWEGAKSKKASLREFNPREQSADEDNLGDLPGLRARSHDLARNDSIAAGAVLTQRRAQVGTGLTPRSQVDLKILGLSEEEATDWQTRADALWWAHAGGTGFDLTGRFSFGILTNLACASQLLSGDALALRRHKERAGEPFATRLQIIEGHRISNPDGIFDNDKIVAGVEFEDERVVAHHIRNESPSGRYLNGRGWSRWPVYGPKSISRISLTLHDPQRAGETRGVPYLSPVIVPLRQLSQYRENEILRALVQSIFQVFLISKHAGEGDTTEFAEPVKKSETKAQLGTDDVREIKMRPGGGIVELQPDEDIKLASPNSPNPQFAAFVSTVTMMAAPALGMAQEVLVKHFTSSFTASRAALVESWRDFLSRRTVLVQQFCDPVREWFITECVLRGYLSAPGFLSDPIIRAAWLYAEWTGPIMGTLNPLQEMNAAEKSIELRLSSRQKKAAELEGTDFNVEHEQIIREEKMWKESGVAPTPLPALPAKTKPGQDNDEEDDSDDEADSNAEDPDAE